MFLRQTRRRKDGKTHCYWSVVENQRLQCGRVVQRHVLYLGEISPSQAAAWRKSIEVFDEEAGHPRTLALFAEDACATVTPDSSVVQLRLSEMRLCRPRQWGACWLAGQLWEELRLGRFWSERLPVNRKGTRWDQVLQVLVSYRLIAPACDTADPPIPPPPRDTAKCERPINRLARLCGFDPGKSDFGWD